MTWLVAAVGGENNGNYSPSNSPWVRGGKPVRQARSLEINNDTRLVPNMEYTDPRCQADLD